MYKKLFALAAVLVALAAFSNIARSQSMYFAEDVDNNGNPIGESSTFTIGSSGGYLNVLVKIPYELNCKSVRYEIYRDGQYDNTFYQDTQTNWQWFYQKMTFYKTGNYTISCIDCYDITLATGTLRIQMK